MKDKELRDLAKRLTQVKNQAVFFSGMHRVFTLPDDAVAHSGLTAEPSLFSAVIDSGVKHDYQWTWIVYAVPKTQFTLHESYYTIVDADSQAGKVGHVSILFDVQDKWAIAKEVLEADTEFTTGAYKERIIYRPQNNEFYIYQLFDEFEELEMEGKDAKQLIEQILLTDAVIDIPKQNNTILNKIKEHLACVISYNM